MIRYTYSTLKEHPYLTVAILSLLVIAEMGLAYLASVPLRYEWLAGWILFLTLLAWVGMVGFTGVIAPVDSKVLLYVAPFLVASLLITTVLSSNDWFTLFLISTIVTLSFVLVSIGSVASANYSAKMYSILVVFPLITVSWLWLYLLLLLGPFEYVGWLVAISYTLAMPLMLGMIALRTILVDRPRTRFLYIVVTMFALGASVVAIALPTVWILDSSTITIRWINIIVAPIFTSLHGAVVILAIIVVATIPVPALVGTMRHPYRNIVVSALGLWSVIIFMGWYWVWTMDDGLDAFTGEERVAAERLLREANCAGHSNPEYRVVKNDRGRLVAELRTWWRFSTTCDAMPEALWDG